MVARTNSFVHACFPCVKIMSNNEQWCSIVTIQVLFDIGYIKRLNSLFFTGFNIVIHLRFKYESINIRRSAIPIIYFCREKHNLLCLIEVENDETKTNTYNIFPGLSND